MGPKTARIPIVHATEPSTSGGASPTFGPSAQARTALITTDTGWLLAKGWSQPGMVSTGTNADDANTSGPRERLHRAVGGTDQVEVLQQLSARAASAFWAAG